MTTTPEAVEFDPLPLHTGAGSPIAITQGERHEHDVFFVDGITLGIIGPAVDGLATYIVLRVQDGPGAFAPYADTWIAGSAVGHHLTTDGAQRSLRIRVLLSSGAELLFAVGMPEYERHAELTGAPALLESLARTQVVAITTHERWVAPPFDLTVGPHGLVFPLEPEETQRAMEEVFYIADRLRSQ